MFEDKKGKGYIGKSQSVNSLNAKLSNKYPKSYWTKKTILEVIEDELEDEIYIEKAKKMPLYVLKECLKYSEYHHTGAFFNVTEFYKFDFQEFIDLNDEEIEKIKLKRKIYLEETKCERKELAKKREIKRQEKNYKKYLLELMPFSHYKRESAFLKAVENNKLLVEELENKRNDFYKSKLDFFEKQYLSFEKKLNNLHNKSISFEEKKNLSEIYSHQIKSSKRWIDYYKNKLSSEKGGC